MRRDPSELMAEQGVMRRCEENVTLKRSSIRFWATMHYENEKENFLPSTTQIHCLNALLRYSFFRGGGYRSNGREGISLAYRYLAGQRSTLKQNRKLLPEGGEGFSLAEGTYRIIEGRAR